MSGIFDEGVEKHTIEENGKGRAKVNPKTVDKGGKIIGRRRKVVKEVGVVEVPGNLEVARAEHDEDVEDGKEVDDNVNGLDDADVVLASLEVGGFEEEVRVEEKDDGDKDEDKEGGAKDKREDDDGEKEIKTTYRKKRRKAENNKKESMDGIVPVGVVVNVHGAKGKHARCNNSLVDGHAGNNKSAKVVERHECLFVDCIDVYFTKYEYETLRKAQMRHIKKEHPNSIALICNNCGAHFIRGFALITHKRKCSRSPSSSRPS
jgi:hypothetical protein